MVQLRHVSVGKVWILFLLTFLCVVSEGQERKIDPTYLQRYVPDVQAKASDLSTETCRYKPIFGWGDAASVPTIMRGVARFGEVTIEARGSCKEVSYAAEEQAWVVMTGVGQLHYGGETSAVKARDFFYIPATVTHSISNDSGVPVQVFIMGFKIEPNTPPPAKLMIANTDEIKKQVLSSHPDSVVYQLMMGSANSKRDRLAAAHLLTSLYVMEFRPGGTNFPHHHDSEEEIYFLMDGHGEMVAGSGENGLEGRHRARAGDAYFFRENCTVGFYNSSDGPAHILAVRSVFPRPASPQYVK
jgi:mannose-6-phosphate isomerase-like protein (cupin superfamily)